MPRQGVLCKKDDCPAKLKNPITVRMGVFVRMRRILILLFTLVFALSAMVTVHKLAQYRSAEQDALEAQETAGAEKDEPSDKLTGEELTPEPSEAEIDPLEDDPYAQTLREIDFAALKEINADVIGWILIPDTQVDYPLLQTDNNEYYLSHTWKKNDNAGGSIFAEQLCSSDLSDFNTIIYGHRMINNSMFGSLKYYKDDSYRREHPAVYVATPERIFRYEIFAAHEPGITEIPYRLKIADEETKRAFLDFSMSRTVIDTGITPDTEDRILTLSTCTGHGHDTRWVVQARLTHEAALKIR